MIMRDQHQIQRRSCLSLIGTGWKRLGRQAGGDAREPHTGSVSRRKPSISISTVECPSQVARRPDWAGLRQASSGLSAGSGAPGTLRSPPHRKSRSEAWSPMVAQAGFYRVDVAKPLPDQRDDACILSSLRPDAFLPRDFIGMLSWSLPPGMASAAGIG
ncbi:Uncharacterised protein [Chromobacterium violaceum]|uniref:Uncharacterized protein n=1 Tax=Chromobacterium violaceum TaxID=536 RepID=A0A3S4I5F3_CHRVL|nr:Uncharacterised protein [Chromobacterium violaceum]